MRRRFGLLLAVLLLCTVLISSAETVRPGSTGATVQSVQTKLAGLGYYTGPIDGTYSTLTYEAVWRFQRDRGLATDGIAGPLTQAALGVTPGAVGVKSLSFGERGSAVTALQSALRNKGYYTGPVDGVYGDSTWQAVWKYQRTISNSPNGIATEEVLRSLGLAGGGGAVVTVLKHGSSGGTVLALNWALYNRGYYAKTPTTLFDDATWQGVWRFQRDQGLFADGIAGSDTLSRLGLSTPTQPSGTVPTAKALKHGAKGDAVAALQRALLQLGYYTGAVDGRFGDTTFEATWWFQKNNGLSPDGVAGQSTLAVINSGYGVRK